MSGVCSTGRSAAGPGWGSLSEPGYGGVVGADFSTICSGHTNKPSSRQMCH